MGEGAGSPSPAITAGSFGRRDDWRVSTRPGSGISRKVAEKEVVVPVHRSKDSQGPYYQWGESGKKYHYEAGDKSSRERAKAKAERQGRAARANGYDG